MKKDDLPYMPFYVGDWFKAPDIRALSYELKGLWFEMLCYMWESKERGVLVNHSGRPYTLEELGRMLCLPEVLLEQKLKQLSDFAVFSKREIDGAIFSRRMVRDQGLRETRQKAGKKGGINSFASRFAKAKTQAKSDNESDIENDINTSFEDLKIPPVDNSGLPHAVMILWNEVFPEKQCRFLSQPITEGVLICTKLQPSFFDLAKWRELFQACRESDFLVNKLSDWFDLSWLCSPANFKKIAGEGKMLGGNGLKPAPTVESMRDEVMRRVAEFDKQKLELKRGKK